MKLTVERRDELLIKLATCVVGIENTDDKGMAGDLKEVRKHLEILNGQVSKNTQFRKLGIWISGVIITAVLTLLVKIFMEG